MGRIIGSDEAVAGRLFFRTISEVISEDLADAAGGKKGESKAVAENAPFSVEKADRNV